MFLLPLPKARHSAVNEGKTFPPLLHTSEDTQTKHLEITDTELMQHRVHDLLTFISHLSITSENTITGSIRPNGSYQKDWVIIHNNLYRSKHVINISPL